MLSSIQDDIERRGSVCLGLPASRMTGRTLLVCVRRDWRPYFTLAKTNSRLSQNARVCARVRESFPLLAKMTLALSQLANQNWWCENARPINTNSSASAKNCESAGLSHPLHTGQTVMICGACAEYQLLRKMWNVTSFCKMRNTTLLRKTHLFAKCEIPPFFAKHEILLFFETYLSTQNVKNCAYYMHANN